VRELVGRLTALDPDAGAAVRVIEYFDTLAEGHVGLEVLVRSAAVLAGCPAGVDDDERHVRLRVRTDGRREDGPPAGAILPLGPDSDACVWLERQGPSHANDAIVLERLAAVVRAVLDRTHVPLRAIDPASVELLLEPGTSDDVRRSAAARLGLSGSGLLRVVVSPAGTDRRRTLTTRLGPLDVTVESASAALTAVPERAGVGTPVPLAEVPDSYQQARIALRLTGSGTSEDPGPGQLWAADLGGLAVLAAGCDTAAAVQEVARLERATGLHPWAPSTLEALGTSGSVRAAATVLQVHHSTLQDRLELLGRALGYSVQTPAGRTRGYLALLLTRLRRNRY
jgi:hypothetical protein